jgi:ligand-binding sensor domain-containing protein/signal transduction histidine kinase
LHRVLAMLFALHDIVKFRFFIAFACCVCFRYAYAQHPNLEFEKFDTREGLSQNLVFTIVQDKKGFLWFGTDEGLNRFDGHEFKIFRHDLRDKNSLSDNSIHALAVDDNGIIWIGTNNGLNRYYPDTETIERLEISGSDPNKPKGTTINDIRQHQNGTIWIGYLGDGVDVYNPATKTYTHYSTNEETTKRIVDNYVIAIQIMPDGVTLLGTRSGIQVIDGEGLPMSDQAAQLKYPWKSKIDNSITTFQLAEDGKVLYVGTELDGFYRVDLVTNQVENFNTQNSALQFNNNVPTIYEDSRRNIWIGAEAIYLFDKKTKVLSPYNELGIRGNVVNKNPVLAIFEDKDHNVWFGTFRLGILKYNPDNTRILHFHADQGEGSLTNNQVLSFNEDSNGELWVGTDGGGLFRMRKDLGGFDRPQLRAKVTPEVIKCIYRDNDGYFWIGTWDAGMIKYHPIKQTLQQFNPEQGNFESRHVWDIKPDSVGNLWLGTLRDGLISFNPKTGAYKYFKNVPGDSLSLVNNDIMCVFFDSRNYLWIGTSDGLSILKPGETNFINFEKNVLNVTVLSIYEDENNRIWLGTNGSGIVIMNKEFVIEKMITEKDGLPSSTICSIVADDRHNIWVSTYNGLVKIAADNTITQIPQIAGIQGKEFIPRSGFKWKGGQLLFGGVNGFNLFHPDSLYFKPLPKMVVFTSLKINNDEVSPGKKINDRIILEKSIPEVDDIHLSYEDYSFTLAFSSLTYNWQSNLHYAYFLEGLDKEWQYTTSSKRYIHYTNLDPGNYTLKVKTSFDGKSWPEEAKLLNISISPPWYATWWFRVALFLLAVLILYLVYKTRVAFLRGQKEKLEQLVVQRTHELQQSNEEIQMLLKEVADKKEKIEEHMLELRQVNEEISAQRDTLEYRSSELERTQKTLREINATLEVLVDKRTQKLTDALRELETFLYRASHDLRGPISSMLGLIGIARLEKDPIKYNQMYTDYLQKTVLNLDRTLQKLLQKHTIEKKKLYPEVIDKTTFLLLLDEVLKDIPFFRPDDLVLSVDDKTKFETDKMLLTIVVSNLLENAFFYSHLAVNKKVLLDVHQNDQYTLITVEDHGPGIKEEVKDKIFTMFYRGHELSAGNGLGLYLVKNVLNKINGKITVETAERSYSRFIVSVPQEIHAQIE